MPVRSTSGTATLRALRSKFKLVRQVISNRRPPKQRNSTQISLQHAAFGLAWDSSLPK